MNGVLRRKAGSFFLRSSLFEQLWFVPVWLMLGLSRGAVLAVAFRRLAPLLGVSVPPYPWVPLVDCRQRLRALRIGRVVRMAAGYTPWCSNCFAQAITARFLLVWYGIPYALFFGLAPAETAGKAQAHAWVASGPVQVTGGAGFETFTVVGCFVGAAGSEPFPPLTCRAKRDAGADGYHAAHPRRR